MKKLLSSIIALCLVLIAMCGLSLGAAAGDSIATAEEIGFDDMIYGQMTESNGKDVYEFDLSESGCITLDVTAYIYRTSYYMYDANGNEVWKETWKYWNDNTEELKASWKINLMQGTYYLAVCREYSDAGNYKFRMSFKSADETFTETLNNTNNSIREADTISLGKTYKGQIALNDEKDLYKFTVSSSGCATFDITAYIYRTSYYLYDANGNEVWKTTWQYWNDNTEEYKNTWQLNLIKGTYYLAICREYGDAGNYKIKTSFKTSSESFTETSDHTNNSIREADAISLKQTYKGQLALNDEKDLYKFTMPASGTVTMNVTAYIHRTSYYLYDSNGNEVWNCRWQYWNDLNKSYTNAHEWTLEKGTYYLAICREDGDAGNYSFSIQCKHLWKTTSVTKATLSKNGNIKYTCSVCKSVTNNTINKPTSFKLSGTSYTYNSSVKAPTVTVKDSAGKTLKKNTDYTVSYASGRKNAGTYKVTVTMIGKYSGTKTLTFKVTPMDVSKCKFSLSTTSYTYDGKVKTPNVTIKDSTGKTLKKDTDYTVAYASGRKSVGTYKVTVTMKGNYTGTKTLTFKINPINISKCKISLSTTSYTYNGKVKKPAVTVKSPSGTTLSTASYTVTYSSGLKNVGTYKVTIKMKGNYTGTKTLTYTIKPTATTVSKLTAGTKSIKVDIAKKSTQVTGYQIQYATSSNFSNATTKTISSYNTTKYTLKSLKAKKTYYVRVRTYKTVNGNNIYSGWSAYKSVKTK